MEFEFSGFLLAGILHFDFDPELAISFCRLVFEVFAFCPSLRVTLRASYNIVSNISLATLYIEVT
jgi:hypothetical protein